MKISLSLLLLFVCPNAVCGKMKIDHLLGTTGFGTINIPLAEREQIIARCFGETRIMDGMEVADITNFKHVAAIVGEKILPSGETVDTSCGAVFVHKNVLLTAKHCVVDLHTIQVRYGGLRSRREWHHFLSLDMETTDNIIAIKFDRESDPTHDYAFILLGELDEDKMEYICLARFNEVVPNLITVMGWGEWDSEPTSADLRYATLSTVIPPATSNLQNCRKPLFCGVPQNAGRNTRIGLGDSGGPVVQSLAHTLVDAWEWQLKLYGIIIEHFTDEPVSVFLDVTNMRFKRRMCTLTGLCFLH